MDFINSFLSVIGDFGIWGYGIVLVVALTEALPFIGWIVPGSIIVGIFGFSSSYGFYDTKFLILFSIVGAVLGDNISYYLGTKGTRFFHNENRFLKLSHLDKGKIFFKNHGNKSVFLGRFISPVRPIVPFIAGLSMMNKKVFLFWNVASAILWSISFILLGYFFGNALHIIEVWSTRAGILFILLFIVVVFVQIIIRRK